MDDSPQSTIHYNHCKSWRQPSRRFDGLRLYEAAGASPRPTGLCVSVHLWTIHHNQRFITITVKSWRQPSRRFDGRRLYEAAGASPRPTGLCVSVHSWTIHRNQRFITITVKSWQQPSRRFDGLRLYEAAGASPRPTGLCVSVHSWTNYRISVFFSMEVVQIWKKVLPRFTSSSSPAALYSFTGESSFDFFQVIFS